GEPAPSALPGDAHMKTGSTTLCVVTVLAGCTLNSSTPLTSWGKKDVSMLDYRTDAGQCALIAATFETGENGARTAGGINGQNSAVPVQGASGSSAAPGSINGGGSASVGTPILGDNKYRDSAPADLVNRAAIQQRSTEMSAQRARVDALKFCLVNRGYTEFRLSPEQRRALHQLPEGSDERREYLFKLGTDPAVLTTQAVVHD
ncbi:MAG TPA: hypothetical protein VFZ95_01880, partial [Steroidobacteraceae bacterium]